MDFKEELIDRLKQEIEIVSKMTSEQLITRNCPSAFGFTDWGYDECDCSMTCEECWKLSLED